LTPIPADTVASPLVEQAPLNLECKVTQILDLGAHHLFLAEVTAVHLDEKVAAHEKKINMDAFRPIVYSYGAHTYHAVGKALGTHGFAKDKF
jgi:flavin reductase (DIM6/NTAB) family NADH-FMN oxidoreductase RutF